MVPFHKKLASQAKALLFLCVVFCNGQPASAPAPPPPAPAPDRSTYAFPFPHFRQGHSAGAVSLALSDDAQTVISGSTDKTARVWRTFRGELLKRQEGHEGRVHSVVVSSDGGVAVSSSQDATIRLWNTETGAVGKEGRVVVFAQDSPSGPPPWAAVQWTTVVS